MKRYSKQRREAVIAKMTGPNRKSIPELVEEEKICSATLYQWRKRARAQGRVMPEGDDTPEGWGSQDKFNAVLETAALSEQELSVYCRERGLYPEQIRRWRQNCAEANDWDRASSKELARARREDRAQLAALEKELRRKNEALAETAALLTLRKKAEAIWGESEDA
ncbi:MAG: helix-turn-helix domain-containing protein [Candidatus Hydrogenedentota bacterium]